MASRPRSRACLRAFSGPSASCRRQTQAMGPIITKRRNRAADVDADTVSGPGFFHVPLSINVLLEYAVSGFRNDAVLP